MMHVDELRARALKFFETEMAPAKSPEQMAAIERRLRRDVAQIEDLDLRELYRQLLFASLRKVTVQKVREAKARRCHP